MKMIQHLFPQKRVIDQQNIVRALRRAHDKYEFPPFMFNDENEAYGKGRLTVFRSEAEWLMVFEFLVYIGELDRYENAIHCYGNRTKGYLWYKEPFILVTNNDEVDPLDFEIRVGENVRRFQSSPAGYLKAGIDLDKPISGDRPFDDRLRILRLLVTLLPNEEIFLSAAALLTMVGRPSTLPVFLRLDEWSHPDPGNPETKFLTPCLRSLIRAIADNNPDEYECPADSINSHWSSWPPWLQFGIPAEKKEDR